MIHGDLFSGIGGFALAARWMGWHTAWFSEIDPYACRVLAKHWPDVPNVGDITTADWSQVERVDILTGGFPCQPHSVAGKRKGSADDRDLWSEFARAIGDLRPRFVLAENVPGLLTSDGGAFFNRILSDLATLGYDAEWTVLSACALGAPHTRERLWLVAYSTGHRRKGELLETGVQAMDDLPPKTLDAWHGLGGPFEHHEQLLAQPGTVRMADGVSSTVDIRPRLRAYGNAIVPQCAAVIYQAIQARENAMKAAA